MADQHGCPTCGDRSFTRWVQCSHHRCPVGWPPHVQHVEPWTRDLRAYAIGSAISIILFTVMLAIVAWVQQPSAKVRPITYNGCYQWSDGEQTCNR